MKKWIIISISIIILAVAGYFGYQFAVDSGSSVPLAIAPVPPALNDSGSNEVFVVQKKWNPGEKIVMEITSSAEADVQVQNQKQPVHTNTRFIQQLGLSDVSTTPDGGHVIELGFENMEMQIINGNQTVSYSSKDSTMSDPKNPMSSLFKNLIDNKITLNTDKDMNIISASGFESISAGIQNEAKTPELKSMFGMNNSTYYKNLINGFYTDASSRSYNVGETWTTQKNTEIPNLGTIKCDLVHTFTGWKDYNGTKAALVNFTGKITSTGKTTSTGSNSSVEMALKDSSISGYSFIDPQNGQSLDYSMNMNMKMDMTIPQRTKQGNTEMKMTMLIKQNTSGKVISRTKIQPVESTATVSQDTI